MAKKGYGSDEKSGKIFVGRLLILLGYFFFGRLIFFGSLIYVFPFW